MTPPMMYAVVQWKSSPTIPPEDRSQDADPRDDRRAVPAKMLRQDLGDERDTGAEFAREADAGDEAQCRIRFDACRERVGEVRRRIQENGTEENRETSLLVAEDAPQNSPEEQARHLRVDEQDTFIEQLLFWNAEVFQALDAYDREEEEIVDVDEIPECRDHDGQDDGFIERLELFH
jgi:hypothetical protein